MLMDFFRRHEKLTYCVLLPVVVFPFVFYYGSSGLGAMGGQSSEVAEIMNQVVTSEDVDQEINRCFGDSPELRRDKVARALALDRVIYREALRQGGASVGDAEISKILDQQRGRGTARRFPNAYWSFYGPASQGIPQDEKSYERIGHLTQPDGLFAGMANERERAWVAGHLTRQGYEDMREVVREEALFQRQELLLADTAKTTDAELYQVYLDQRTKLKARYATVDVKACEALIPAADLGEEAVKKFFEERKDKPRSEHGYQVPERATVAWLLADMEAINKSLPVEPADVEAYYSAHKQDWTDPNTKQAKPLEQVREMIVKELNREKVQNKADDMMLSAREAPEAEPFAETAKHLSLANGSGTLELGGEEKVEGLGMVAGLKEALEGLEPGARAAATLDCEKGRCMVRLLSREAAHAPAFADVRDKVLADLKAEKAKGIAQALLSRLKAGIKPDNFEAAVAEAARNPLGPGAPLPAPFPGLHSGMTDPFSNPAFSHDPLPGMLAKHNEAVRAVFELKDIGEVTEPGFSNDGSEGILLQSAERLLPEPNGFLKEHEALANQFRDRVGQAIQRDWRKAVASKARLRGVKAKPGQPQAAPDDESDSE